MKEQDRLRERTVEFRNALDLPVTKFLKKVNLSRTGYYEWLTGNYNLSEQRAAIIDNFLRKFGF